jgi:N-methylhydantoinase A/oxoprolinase/acetone carboxylase beta subunit
MTFSTTLATNAIVQDRLEPTGMIVSAGPGADPSWFAVGPSYHVVDGCLDHQGLEALPLDREQVLEAGRRMRAKGIQVAGVVGKFSVRNPSHEQQICAWIGKDLSHVAMGHRVSGNLNFPRRIATTYLNAALHGIHAQFISALQSILSEKQLDSPHYLLKPDGGTLALQASGESPAKAAQSGPAASVMGALALDGCSGTALVLDIGGTTTDISVVLDGVPLLDPHGIRLGPYRTLVRSLLTHSVGVGGDSETCIEDNGTMRIGPLRRDVPAALGGSAPTPTDAMVALGLLALGDRKAAVRAMEVLGSPSGWPPETTAEQVLSRMAEIIAQSASSFVHEINSRPVYTIHEVLHEDRIEPTVAVLIGGPATQMAPYLSRALGLPHRVPPHCSVANAIGSAVARVTDEITLHSDTQRGSVVIPEAHLQKSVDTRFGLDQAVALGTEVLRKRALKAGADPQTLEISVLEKQVFNMIRGFARTGQNIRLRLGIVPGLIPGWRRTS